ncbi:MAG: hypothetical protein OEZ00_05555 [Dehalococcoidia bacterium]|nr:hypothetical protein [Dehalococcoidia bacterium]
MKWLKRILISLAILILAGLGGFIVYGAAYSEGEAAGYDNGYSVGQEAGYDLGKQDGYDEGYVSGKEDGYSEGYDLGKEDGYEEGAQAGLGHGYTLRDTTYKEAVTFLKQDKTDQNKYVEDTYGVYVCSHFARDVGNNAEDQGLRCAFVELRYPEQGHAIIAFDTIDEGLVYFEPRTDERAKPVIGKNYYECVEPKPGYYYEQPSYDDTIMDILVIW